VLTRCWIMVRQTVAETPELFFPVFVILVWRITDLAAKPRTLMIASCPTGVLLFYGFRVLGGSVWLRNLGWVTPRKGFWLFSILAGIIAGGTVWLTVRVLHESLGTLPSPQIVLLASSSGSLLEELVFRGFLFWFVLEFFRRLRWPRRSSAVGTVVLIAIGFAFAHLGRTGTSFYSTVLTGIAFGAIRISSESTAAAALMHAPTYNFTLSLASIP